LVHNLHIASSDYLIEWNVTLKAHRNELSNGLDLARKLNLNVGKETECFEASREERKREASKPLYLIRYE